MKVRLLPLALTAFISGCIVLPVTDPTHYNKCEISSDKKHLKYLIFMKTTITIIPLVAFFYYR